MIAPASSRFSLAILMAFIGVIAVGLGGMRVGSGAAAKAAFGLMLFLLQAGLLGMLVRRGGGAWLGFTLFGWSYAALHFVPGLQATYAEMLPTSGVVSHLGDSMHPDLVPPPARPVFGNQDLHRFTESLRDVMEISEINHPEIYNHMNPADKGAFEGFKAKVETYEGQVVRSRESRKNALIVGHAASVLEVALAGAILGRALERPRRPSPHPSGG